MLCISRFLAKFVQLSLLFVQLSLLFVQLSCTICTVIMYYLYSYHVLFVQLSCTICTVIMYYLYSYHVLFVQFIMYYFYSYPVLHLSSKYLLKYVCSSHASSSVFLTKLWLNQYCFITFSFISKVFSIR